jgi:heme-degrading monooxygenase HmoA
MWARQTRVQADPAKLDQAIEQIRNTVQPALEQADGYKGFTVLIDRDSGELVGTSYFESREAVEASESAVRGPRDEAAQVAGAATPDVRFYEVVIDTEA